MKHIALAFVLACCLLAVLAEPDVEMVFDLDDDFSNLRRIVFKRGSIGEIIRELEEEMEKRGTGTMRYFSKE